MSSSSTDESIPPPRAGLRSGVVCSSANLGTEPADALSNAVLNGDLTRVSRLLDNGANPNAVDSVSVLFWHNMVQWPFD